MVDRTDIVQVMQVLPSASALIISFCLIFFAYQTNALEDTKRSFAISDDQNVHLSETFEDQSWSLRLEANPSQSLVNGNPRHWQYTNRGKPLRVLIMRARWLETGREEIPIEGNLNQSMEDTRLFFSDSSWAKVDFEFFYSPVLNLSTPAANSNSGTIKAEALAEAAKLGYVWCGGPCGTNLATSQYQSADQASDLIAGNFDMAVVAHRAGPPYNLGYAGLGMIGEGFSWTVYPTSAGVMEHEIGHNFGELFVRCILMPARKMIVL